MYSRQLLLNNTKKHLKNVSLYTQYQVDLIREHNKTLELQIQLKEKSSLIYTLQKSTLLFSFEYIPLCISLLLTSFVYIKISHTKEAAVSLFFSLTRLFGTLIFKPSLTTITYCMDLLQNMLNKWFTLFNIQDKTNTSISIPEYSTTSWFQDIIHFVGIKTKQIPDYIPTIVNTNTYTNNALTYYDHIESQLETTSVTSIELCICLITILTFISFFIFFIIIKKFSQVEKIQFFNMYVHFRK